MSKPKEQSFRDWLTGLLHAVEQGPPAPDSAEVFADTILEALAKRLERAKPKEISPEQLARMVGTPDKLAATEAMGYNTALRSYEAAIRKELE